MFKALAEGLHTGAVEFVEVLLQSLLQCFANRGLLRRAGEQIENQLQLLLIMSQQMIARHLHCFARDLRGDKRIAVAVAPNP